MGVKVRVDKVHSGLIVDMLIKSLSIGFSLIRRLRQVQPDSVLKGIVLVMINIMFVSREAICLAGAGFIHLRIINTNTILYGMETFLHFFSR